MVSAISITCAVCFILVNIAKSQFSPSYSADNETSWKSGRPKRSIYYNMPSQLELRVKYSTGEEIDLCWVKQNRYLANEHLPVMTTLHDYMPNVMTDVGEFIIYHDIEKCSAVVYFDKLKKLYGVIGTGYYVRGLPFHFNHNGKYTLGVVGDQYITVNEHPFVHIHPDEIFPPPTDTEAWEHFLHLTYYDLDQNSGGSIDAVPGPSNTKQQAFDGNNGIEQDVNEYRGGYVRKPPNDPKSLEYLLETLVIVTSDIAMPFKKYFGEDHYIEWIVRHYIIYLNAVDMIFKKLPVGHAEFFINIARIIIEDDSKPFGFTVNNGELQFTDVTEKLPNYLRKEDFPEDSIDHVFIHTHRKIMDYNVPVNGLTKRSGDLYEARKSNKFYDAISITVVGFKYNYADFTVAVHEFGRVLKMRIDRHEKRSERIKQCQAIMQREGPKCDNCLKWSANSMKHYEIFFRTNRNRCFLLNKPRSLRPQIPVRGLTLHRQCLCFGYDSSIMNLKGHLAHVVGLHSCTEPLQCQYNHEEGSYSESTVRPFDGTRCTHTKICWHGECVPVPYRVDVE